MNYLLSFLNETWALLNSMSPYLLLGFFIAGILHIIVPAELLYKHLSKHNFISIVKAAMFGVPIPLCSCSVIPVSQHLHKKGASKGAVISFLSSAPTTGVDSILATYSLMGPVFAIFRPISSFLIGILSGIFVNAVDKDKNKEAAFDNKMSLSHLTLKERFFEFLKYSFYDLPSDIAKWLLIGIIAGGIISFILPAEFPLIHSPYFSYPLMLIIGIPMYVCATGSIPIAAALIAKGMSPGAALVFLISGPATNTATIVFVSGIFGKKVVSVYIATITVISLAMGIILDLLVSNMGLNLMQKHIHGSETQNLFFHISSGLLLFLLLMPHIREKYFVKKSEPCCHCDHK